MEQQTSKELLKQIHAYIESLPYSHEPKGLYDPIEYVLGLGGKRLRPVLMLLAYNLFKEDVQAIFSQATAIETYHNFTLLHDDLKRICVVENLPFIKNGMKIQLFFPEMQC